MLICKEGPNYRALRIIIGILLLHLLLLCIVIIVTLIIVERYEKRDKNVWKILPTKLERGHSALLANEAALKLGKQTGIIDSARKNSPPSSVFPPIK